MLSVPRHPCAGNAQAAPCADLAHLYASVPAIMFATDDRGHLVSMSNLLAARLGRSRDSLLGQGAAELFDESGRRRFEQDIWPALLDGGHIHRMAARLHRGSDAAPIDVLLSGYAVYGVGNELRGTVLFGEDVSEQNRHAAELDTERRRLDDILTATDAGTWEWNVATGAVRFNERWASMLGHTLASLEPLQVENTWIRFTHPADMDRCRKALQHHFEGKSLLYECTFRMRHRLGHWVWILARGKVTTRSSDGRPEWMLGTHLDITSVKKQQARLRETRRMLDRVCETAAIGGFAADIGIGTFSPTRQTAQLLDMRTNEPSPLAEILSAIPAGDRRQLLRTALTSRRTGKAWQLDVSHLSPSGTCRMLHVTGRQEAGPDGVERVLGSVQDVTARYAERTLLDTALKRLRAASMASGMGVWSLSPADGVVQADAQLFAMLGLVGDPGRLPARSVLRQLHRDDRLRFVKGLREALAGRTMHQDEVRVSAAGGGVRHLKGAAIIERGSDGLAASVIGAAWDVTEPRELEHRLSYQQRLLQVTLNSIADAVVTTDPEGTPDWMNSSAAQLLSAACEGPHKLPPEVEHAARECLTHGDALWSETPIRIEAQNGDEMSVDFSTSPIQLAGGAAHGAVIVMRNVTQQQRAASVMAWRATHDALTDLVNRTEFEQRLEQSLVAVSSSKTPHALLYLDLDQFKLVNDACGHMVGDTLLQQVANMIADSVRSGDTVSRLGGDEFAVILSGCDSDQARRAAQAICDRLDNFRFQHEDRRFRVGVSIGLVDIDPTAHADAGSVLRAADAACYAAKDSGRNRVHTWEAADGAIAARQGEMQWVARIEQALDEGSFELHGQKIVPLGPDQAGLHLELLLRMRQPDGVLISPGAFIPAAERFNLSTRVDAWVVRAALDWLSQRDALSAVCMVSINLSGRSVGDPLFRETLVELLRAQPLAVRQRICLEITETSAVTHMDNAKELVDEVRDLGVSVALDDFGAGASSFGYLRQLKVDFLKIDGQYVRDLLEDPLDSAAIKCFVEVARVTGLRTVAEFVEREDVLLELRRIGVDFAQGYLMHRPEPLRTLVACELAGRTAASGS